MILYLTILITITSTLAFAGYKKQFAVFMVVFLAPWQGLEIDAGLRLTAYQIVVATTVAYFLLGWARRPKIKRVTKYDNLMVFMVFYAISWSLICLPLLPGASVEGGVFRSPAVRGLTQIFQFILTLAPIWLLPWALQRSRDIIQVARVYLFSLVLLAFLGWLQLFVWFVTGNDPLPIGVINTLFGGGNELRSGVLGHEGQNIFRMSSLGGEPKVLAMSLVVALLLLQSGLARFYRAGLTWGFLFVSLLATWSTMGLILWAAGSMIQMGTHLRGQGKVRLTARRVFVFICVLPMILWALVVTNAANRLVFDLVEARTVGRIAENASSSGVGGMGFLEDFNSAVADFLIDRPIYLLCGVGLGNAHLFANDYLPTYAQSYADGTVFVAKSAGLRLISEVGLPMTLVFLGWLLYLGYSLGRLARLCGFSGVVRPFSRNLYIPLVFIWLASGYVTPQFFLAVGCMASLMRRLRKYSCTGRSAPLPNS